MQKKWWHRKTAYQIYPKSFCDSNGDGIGDIRGIISKLPYLEELGVEIVWVSPIYCSPLADQGYDISDYYGIDPRFGTMEDMEELIAKAKEHNISILMDLVVNHCSDEHIWFQEALKDTEGKYGRYFYIEEGREGGQPPCNWRSYFGGSAWERIPGTNKYYLHLFHKKQPDLNWENPGVREEIYKMMNWWLEKGIEGFRIDAIMNIKKPLPFKDFPSDRDDGLCSPQAALEQAVGIGEFLHEMKVRTFDRYDAFSVGEVFGEKEEELPNFIGDDGYFSSMFDFSATIFGKSPKGWYDAKPITANDYRACCFSARKRVGDLGFLSNIIENHDEPRGVSHYIPEGDCNDTSKKMLGAINFMLKGIPFLYQGQEIGMENSNFGSMDQVDDISTIDEYDVCLKAGLSEEEALKVVSHFSRDNGRAPFQWDDSPNAGFTSGEPWLRVNPNYRAINAKSQVGKEGSVFAFYQKMIALRKSQEYGDTIVYGTFEPVWEERDNLIAYYRRGERNTVLLVANFQNQEQEIPLSTYKNVLLNNYGDMAAEDGKIRLHGYQALLLEV